MLLKNHIAYLGMLLGINQLFLLLSSFLKQNTLVLFGAAALTIGIVIEEVGIKKAWIFYFSSSILSLIICANKIELLVYIFVFGLYSLIREHIELFSIKKNITLIKNILIKSIYFLFVLLLVNFVFIKYVFVYSFQIQLKWWMIGIAFIFFYIYDYAYGFFLYKYIRYKHMF